MSLVYILVAAFTMMRFYDVLNVTYQSCSRLMCTVLLLKLR